MIEKMIKYTFILHHTDYLEFLKNLQKLGMVHIIKTSKDKTEKLIKTKNDIEAYVNDIRFMKKWVSDNSEKKNTHLLPIQLKSQIDQAHLDRDRLKHIYSVLAKDIKELEPWGDFSYELLKSLAEDGIQVDLYSCSKNHFKEEWNQQYVVQIINSIAHMIYFAVVHKLNEPVTIEAEPFKLPPKTLSELKKHEIEIAQELDGIEQFYKDNALTAIDLFENEIKSLSYEYEFEDATLQALPEAENQILIMQGWIPKRLKSAVEEFLINSDIVFFMNEPTSDDDVPIMLRNNAFSKLFEPIARMFMLPHYNDLDLTPFFAPFYLMFFGFCSGDLGYGIVLFLLGFLLKKKTKEASVIPFLNLIQLLGLGTVVMGFVMGSVFAFDLKTIPWIAKAILIKDTNQIFNFALLLGVIQILWGIIINSVKQMRQSGVKGGIATLGTFIFLLSLALTGSTLMGANPGNILNYTKYASYIGLFLIFFFNSPGKNLFINFASGLWLMYNLVTGFFGDLLSYIRLFALGVSSAILGIVVNSMAKQFSSIPIIGPVVFLLFMFAGHGLNIALSSLGAFVHPLRLTFVEFYKNAGFNGPGLEFKPFGKK